MNMFEKTRVMVGFYTNAGLSQLGHYESQNVPEKHSPLGQKHFFVYREKGYSTSGCLGTLCTLLRHPPTFPMLKKIIV